MEREASNLVHELVALVLLVVAVVIGYTIFAVISTLFKEIHPVGNLVNSILCYNNISTILVVIACGMLFLPARFIKTTTEAVEIDKESLQYYNKLPLRIRKLLPENNKEAAFYIREYNKISLIEYLMLNKHRDKVMTEKIIYGHSREQVTLEGTAFISGGFINIGNTFLKRGIIALDNNERVQLKIEYCTLDKIETKSNNSAHRFHYEYITDFNVIECNNRLVGC